MEDAHVADRERLDQATSLLMASLQESRALNLEISKALRNREEVRQTEADEALDQPDATVFGILRDIIDGISRR